MEVSLDPTRWPKVARFTSHEEFEDWLESPESQGSLAKGSYEWPSDSAIAYFHIAEALEKLAGHEKSPGPALEHGYCRLIAENGHPDELGTGDLTSGCYWISATPETTRKIFDAMNLCAPSDVYDAFESTGVEIDAEKWGLDREDFVEVLEQHRKVVEVAVANGMGLLGHCG